MFTPGPSRKFTLRARASLPRASPRSAGKVFVPGGGQRNPAGIGGRRSPGAHAHRSVGHLEARQADRRHGLGEHAVHAAQQLDLLFQRELGYQRMGLGLNRG